MAFVHGKDTKVFFNNNDFGQYFNSIDFARTVDVAETTAFGMITKLMLQVIGTVQYQ